MNIPKVSVLIPTYNYARFLDEAIQSVLNQTFDDFELLIVDNCSTDNTEEVITKYLPDKRITYYVNDKNIGLVGNWNKCLQLAKGEYIKFLCADDKFHPHLLQKFVTVMAENKNVSIITSFSEVFGVKTEIRTTPFSGVISGQTIINNLINNKIYNWIGEPTTVMFRRKDLKVGKFNDQLKMVIDLEYWIRLLKVGDCYIIPEVLSYFRTHDETQTSNVLKRKYEHTFESYNFATFIKTEGNLQSEDSLNKINEIIRKRAIGCASIMYKALPGLLRKKNRKYFIQALSIGRRENVVFQPLLKLFNNHNDSL